tara:strand:+ start:125 stop:958 length:834 start_codon:yes stop_codon:yes gene_type:complete
MANRFPLVVDSSALQIKEIPANDNLDLANNSIVNVVNITASGNVSVGGTLTYEDVQNIDSVGLVTARTGIKVLAGGINAVGVVTATTFSGSGANLTNLPSGQLTGALPAIDGSALTGVISGVGINTAGGNVGYGVTLFDFRGAGISTITAPVAGISTINITGGGGGGGGISTAAATVTNGQTTLLDLSSAQDHKITCTGTITISCTGGTEGESHTVRIINSGTATVGFSTYFLFPSGATPSLPTGSGDISLISFTVNREGTTGISTQLLAGASLNFS